VLAEITASTLLSVFPVSVLPGLAFLSVYKALTNPERASPSQTGSGLLVPARSGKGKNLFILKKYLALDRV
jgi:hypothetical protein